MADRIMPCPYCGKNYNISTFNPGMKFRCTQCSNTVTVPNDEPRYEEARPSRSSRPSRGAAPAASRGGGVGGRRRREFDEEEMDRGGRDKLPRKKDNTVIIAVMAAVGIAVLAGVIFALMPGGELAKTPPPLDATPSNFSGTYGTPKAADWSKTESPEPGQPTPSGGAGTTDSVDPADPDASAEPGKSGTPVVPSKSYVELADAEKPLQDFVAKVVENYGGMEAMKFNKTFSADVMYKSNISRDRDVDDKDPMAPFAWKAETELSARIMWKRSGTMDKLASVKVQSSIRITSLWDGKTLRRFIDKNPANVDEATKQRVKDEAYDMDFMYKLGNGQLRFQNQLREKRRIKISDSTVTCDYFLVQDRLTGREMQMCFYNDALYADWIGLPFMISYKDEYNREQIKRYFWNYGEKSRMKFPHLTLTARYPLKDDGTADESKTPGIEMLQILKENDDEMGEIKVAAEIDDIYFEKPADR